MFTAECLLVDYRHKMPISYWRQRKLPRAGIWYKFAGTYNCFYSIAVRTQDNVSVLKVITSNCKGTAESMFTLCKTWLSDIGNSLPYLYDIILDLGVAYYKNLIQ